MCSKLKNNQEKSVIDKSLSGIFINNRSSLMSYEDYQSILDRITLRLDSIVQEASTWVRIIPYFIIESNLILYIFFTIELSINCFLLKDESEGISAEERIKTHFKSDNQWTKRWIESTKKRGLIRRNRINDIDNNISKSHILNEFIKEGNYHRNKLI